MPDYDALGQTLFETVLLMEHDQDEELHAFLPGIAPGEHHFCRECGDDSSGLMHNNTWRNVEPLMVPACGDPGPDCVEHDGACD